MDKVRVLAIAPYEGMKNMLESIASQRDDIELEAHVGDLQAGVDIVKGLELSDYDVILSRGGTAEMIKEVAAIPLLEVSLTHYDILSAIKLAQNCSGKFAIVGFPSISNFSRMLCDILKFDIDIFTIHSKAQAVQCVDILKREGYFMILSDMIATTYAKSVDLHAILITSGSESISATLDQAVNLCRYHAGLRRENHYYAHSMKISDQILIIHSASGQFLFSSAPPEEIAAYLKITKNMLPQVLGEGDQRLLKRVSGRMLIIVGKRSAIRGEACVCFAISKSDWASKPHGHGIHIENRADVEKRLFSPFYSDNTHREIRAAAERLSKSNLPVLIVGERGTGKDKLADLTYSMSRLGTSLYYIFDCAALGQQSWRYLFESPDSPLYSNGNTFFFKSVGQIKESTRGELFAFIESCQLGKKNRLIFSYMSEIEAAKDDPLCLYLKNKLGCLSFSLSPLRQRIHDIPSLASLYLNEINTTTAKQISGLEPEGMSLLQGFSWESNLEQFKRVLDELVAMTDTPYIKTEDVRGLLRNETRQTAPDSALSGRVNLNQKLDDIVFDVANKVLAEENMNQTKAAKRLGIGRTTLWRILNR